MLLWGDGLAVVGLTLLAFGTGAQASMFRRDFSSLNGSYTRLRQSDSEAEVQLSVMMLALLWLAQASGRYRKRSARDLANAYWTVGRYTLSKAAWSVLRWPFVRAPDSGRGRRRCSRARQTPAAGDGLDHPHFWFRARSDRSNSRGDPGRLVTGHESNGGRVLLEPHSRPDNGARRGNRKPRCSATRARYTWLRPELDEISHRLVAGRAQTSPTREAIRGSRPVAKTAQA
jgi:hypothetical protein